MDWVLVNHTQESIDAKTAGFLVGTKLLEIRPTTLADSVSYLSHLGLR